MKKLSLKARCKKREKQVIHPSSLKPAEVIDVDEVKLHNPEDPPIWVNDLTRKDEEVLLQSNGWLNDKIINAAQGLIKAAHPHVIGLQDVVLGTTLGFNVMTGPFIQILHTGKAQQLTIKY